MQATASTAVTLLKETVHEWQEDNASRLAAALSYYSIFSLGPLLLIAITIAGFFFGEEAVRGQLAQQIEGLVGRQGAEFVQTAIAKASNRGTGLLATVIGIATLLFGASGLFGELHSALNQIWEVEPKKDRGIIGTIKERFLSMTMVLGIGFLLLVSLVISAGITALSTVLGDALPGSALLWQAVNVVISLGVITLLFALIFKVLPDAEVAWRDVWVGAAVTAVLFTIGKLLIGLYLGRASVADSFGAAGSIIVILASAA